MTKLSLTKSKKIILSAMLLSILIVLSRFFSIKSSFLVISFSFIPMMLAGIYLGPKYAATIAGLGDLIGAILFPFGAYFPGFTISSALIGFIYGIFLYKKPEESRKDFKFIIQLIISSILVLIGIIGLGFGYVGMIIKEFAMFWQGSPHRITIPLYRFPRKNQLFAEKKCDNFWKR